MQESGTVGENTSPSSGVELQENKEQPREDEEENVNMIEHLPEAHSGVLGLNYWVFGFSVAIIWAMVIYTMADESGAADEFADWQRWVSDKFSWFYVACIGFFGFFCFFLIFSKYGDLKLGPEDEEPQYNLMTWFTMLFSAGIGIGLYFYGVAEPVYHYTGPNRYIHDGRSVSEKAQDAMNLSWFHWGLGASSVYCIVGLPLAWFAHRKGFPMTLRTCFYPILGNKIFGRWGDFIEITAVVSTMFGVATSLGLGVKQISSGLNRMNSDIADDKDTHLVVIWVITGIATCSVVSGVGVGIRRLSEFNFGLSLFLLFYMFFVYDTFYLLNFLVQSFGYHIQHIIGLTFHVDAIEQAFIAGPTQTDANRVSGWFSGWTTFYWAWWIAWSPFVGVFLAQISRGRTIRQFILGNMVVPTVLTSVWLLIFGGIGLKMQIRAEHNIAQIPLCKTVTKPTYEQCTFDSNTLLSERPDSQMLFDVLENLPLHQLTWPLSVIGIVLYFVTSSDSASLVIDLLSCNGKDATTGTRVFWALTEGAVASALLSTGDKALGALRAVSIVAGLPFCFVLLFMTWSLWRALNEDTNGPVQNQNKWSVGLFESTFQEPQTGLTAFVAPCLVQQQNRQSAVFRGEGAGERFFWSFMILMPPFLFILFEILEVADHGFAYFGWTFYLSFVVVGTYHRYKIRTANQIGGNFFVDLISTCFCYACSITQEKIECDGAVQKVAASSEVDVKTDQVGTV